MFVFFCKKFPEKLLHLFWECERVQYLWREISKWLNEKMHPSNHIRFNAFLVCFGKFDDPKCLISIITLLGKKFIFNNKCQENSFLSVSLFKHFVKDYYTSEKSLATANGKLQNFKNQWRNIFD